MHVNLIILSLNHPKLDSGFFIAYAICRTNFIERIVCHHAFNG
jgi:hypothetical protein